MTAARTVTTDDGLRLEAELRPAFGGTSDVGVVLCHPHPQYGGTMRSLVVGALFEALPAAGATCLRFNFRGVEGSEGAWDEGRSERLDVVAAVRLLESEIPPEVPLVLCGWSFGADLALTCAEPRLAGWIAVAPPLRFAADFAAAADPRPVWLLLAEHDEVRDPSSVPALTGSWSATEIRVVRGASHFFVGRTGELVEEVTAALVSIVR